MAFNSLANLLLSKRSDSIVAFELNNDNDINWKQFLADVKYLILLIKNKPCQSVAICCDNSYLFSVAFFASLYTNKKVVLPGNHQPAMLLSLSSEFDLLIDDGIVEETLKANLADNSFIRLSMSMLSHSLTNECVSFDFYPLNLSAIEILLFTSGSTGLPKAIKKSLLMLDAEIDALEKQFGSVLEQSRIVSTVSHQHIYGLLFRVLWPLSAERPFAMTDIIYPEQVIQNGTKEHTLISSPALLKRLQHEIIKGDYCSVFSSGGPLSSDASDSCKECLNSTAIEVFGSTETGGIGFRQQHTSNSLWSFFSEVKVKNIEGCLALSSPWLSEKLDKSLSDEYSCDGYYQTNDLCELLENHQFKLKGRVDSIVKIEEKRVSLVEVELHLDALPWISESAVIVITEEHRVTLGALLTLTTEGDVELSTLGKGRFWIKLRQSLRDWVEPVAIPRHFRIVTSIPMNKQGKRLTQEIAELFK
ncbi:AMP-binding protein [Psychromonas sp.]|nr:AMP-binding protein [Psychromonas sp.]